MPAMRDTLSHYRGFAFERCALKYLHAQPLALSSLTNVNVDIEIDAAHAGLRRLMRAAFMPAAGARACIADIVQLQASPLRQRP